MNSILLFEINSWELKLRVLNFERFYNSTNNYGYNTKNRYIYNEERY